MSTITDIEIESFVEQFLGDEVSRCILDETSSHQIKKEIWREANNYFGGSVPDQVLARILNLIIYLSQTFNSQDCTI